MLKFQLFFGHYLIWNPWQKNKHKSLIIVGNTGTSKPYFFWRGACGTPNSVPCLIPPPPWDLKKKQTFFCFGWVCHNHSTPGHGLDNIWKTRTTEHLNRIWKIKMWNNPLCASLIKTQGTVNSWLSLDLSGVPGSDHIYNSILGWIGLGCDVSGRVSSSVSGALSGLGPPANCVKSAHFGAFWDNCSHLSPSKHSKPPPHRKWSWTHRCYNIIMFYCAEIILLKTSRHRLEILTHLDLNDIGLMNCSFLQNGYDIYVYFQSAEINVHE